MGEIVRWSIKDEDCFSQCSQVLTPLGAVEIQNIKPNDIVYQYDSIKNSLEETRVIRTVKTKKNVQYKLVDKDGNTVQTITPNHRVLYNVDGTVFENTAVELEGKTIKLPSVKFRITELDDNLKEICFGIRDGKYEHCVLDEFIEDFSPAVCEEVLGMYADELKNKTIKRLETIRDLKIFDEEVTVVRE